MPPSQRLLQGPSAAALNLHQDVHHDGDTSVLAYSHCLLATWYSMCVQFLVSSLQENPLAIRGLTGQRPRVVP